MAIVRAGGRSITPWGLTTIIAAGKVSYSQAHSSCMQITNIIRWFLHLLSGKEKDTDSPIIQIVV